MAMHILHIDIKRINPALYNPRLDLKPGDPEYEKLKRSMNEFGCVEPLVWNSRTGNLVGGHQRFKILVEQGASSVDVSVVDLPLEREKALNIALNKISGDWDEVKLAALLEDLGEIPDFDVSVTGFDSPEISQLLDRLLPDGSADDDGFDLGDALDAGASEAPVTQDGELVELGRHRLLCGDSAKPDDVTRACEGMDVSLLFTDPPYNVNYYGGNRPSPLKARPKQSRQWERIYQDDLTQAEYEQWLTQTLTNGLSVLSKGSAFYIWNGHRQFGPMHQMLSDLDCHISCVITWAKESFAIGYGDYNQQTEFCLYGWKADGTAHRWYGPTNESTLWNITRDSTKEYRHPTQKPLALADRAIRNSTQREEVVLDLFLGSGSTLIAAERLERSCVGIEIDPRYCDAIVRRYLAIADDPPAALVERYALPGETAGPHAPAAIAGAVDTPSTDSRPTPAQPTDSTTPSPSDREAVA